jgi:hypothetical protein
MQKYLNIDPMDGGASLHEGAGLLGQTGLDEEAPSMPMQTLPGTGNSPSSSHGGNTFAPAGATNRTPTFSTPAAVSSGYVPPSGNPFNPATTTDAPASPSQGPSGDDSINNPMAPRYPLPTISAAGAGLGPPPPSVAPSSSAAASKSKKAMKEPKSMRSST